MLESSRLPVWQRSSAPRTYVRPPYCPGLDVAMPCAPGMEGYASTARYEERAVVVLQELKY